jgi:hypothetical protein
MNRKITFPAVKGTNVRRNAETGIEITNDGRDGWSVRTFHADKGDMYESFPTLAAAREAATEQVHLFRDEIAAAYAEAHAEYAARIAATLEDHAELMNVYPGTVLATVHAAAVRSLSAAMAHPGTLGGFGREMSGYLRAAAERTARLLRLLDGTEYAPAPEELRTALADTRRRYPVGTVVRALDLPAEATVDREPFIDAEQGRVCVPLKTGNGYATVYADRIQQQSRDADAHLPVAGVPGTSLGEMREAFRDEPAKPEPAPVKYDSGLKVRLADDATHKPEGHEGDTFETDWRAEPEHTPGGRLMIQVFRSYDDPRRGFTTIAPLVWLDELRTLDGARIVP